MESMYVNVYVIGRGPYEFDVFAGPHRLLTSGSAWSTDAAQQAGVQAAKDYLLEHDWDGMIYTSFKREGEQLGRREKGELFICSEARKKPSLLRRIFATV